MARQMNLQLVIGADGKAVAPATAEVRREVESVAKVAKAANDDAARSAKLFTDAISGQAAAERTLRDVINARLGISDKARMVGTPFELNADRGRDIEAYGRQLDSLRAKYNPLYGEISRYRMLLTEIREAHALGAISADEMTAAINRERTAALASIGALKGRQSALMGAGGVPGSFQTANVAAQFQDIFVTSAMGMNPVMVALQQGTQLQQVLGAQGATGAVKMLGSAFLSLANPVSLATIGLTGVASAAIGYFAAFDEADSAEAVLSKQADLIRAVADRWGHALPALKAYADELSKHESNAERAEGVQAAINRRFSDAADVLPRLRQEVGDFIRQAIELGMSTPQEIQKLGDALDAVQRDAVNLRTAFERGGSYVKEYESLHVSLGRVLENDSVRASETLRGVVGDLARAYSAAALEARRFAEEQASAMAGGPIGGERVAGGKGARPGEVNPLDPLDFWRRTGGLDDLRDDLTASKRRGSKRETTTDFDRELAQLHDRTRALENEAAVVGMSVFAREKYLATQALEIAAGKDAIGLTRQRVEVIDLESDAYARLVVQANERNKAEQEAQAATMFNRSLASSAMTDMRAALRDGKLEWEEVGDIAVNAMDRIIDKIQNELLDAIFDLNEGANRNGGGILGIIRSMLGIGGGLFGTGLNNTTNFIDGRGGGFAALIGYDQGGPTGGTDPTRIAGFVHEQEYVFDAVSTRRIGVGKLDAIRRGALNGYREGGYAVADGIAPGRGGSGGGGQTPAIRFEVVDRAGVTIQQAGEARQDANGDLTIPLLINQLEEKMVASMQGGALGRATQQTFGLARGNLR